MTTTASALASLDEKKAAIRAVLADLATAAEAAGLPWVARDIRDTRLPKLDDERFSVVVLGEFNHGKSTFINALLGAPVLPTGHHADDRAAGPHHARRARERDRGHRVGRAPADRRAPRWPTGSPSTGWPRQRTSKGKAPSGQDGRRRHPPRRDRLTRRRCWRTG